MLNKSFKPVIEVSKLLTVTFKLPLLIDVFPSADAFKVIGGPGAPTASEGATKTEKKKNGMFSGFID